MNRTDRIRRLERECRLFCEYLLACEPSDYSIGKYRKAHEVHPDFVNDSLRPFDRALVRLGSLTPATARVVDRYSRLFAPRSVFRKKLILLLAILENSPGTLERLETPTTSSALTVYLMIGARCMGFVVELVLAAAVLLPLQLVSHAGFPGRDRGN